MEITSLFCTFQIFASKLWFAKSWMSSLNLAFTGSSTTTKVGSWFTSTYESKTVKRYSTMFRIDPRSSGKVGRRDSVTGTGSELTRASFRGSPISENTSFKRILKGNSPKTQILSHTWRLFEKFDYPFADSEELCTASLWPCRSRGRHRYQSCLSTRELRCLLLHRHFQHPTRRFCRR